MRQISYVLLGAILCLLASCVNTVQEAFIPIDGSKLEVTAYAPDGSATKTGITENESGGKNVIWKAGNSISLFFNSGENGGNMFTTADGGLIAKFTGSISAISGDLSGTGGKAYFWAVYPYSSTVSCDGTGVTSNLPATQSAYVNDIADNLLVTVGRSENLSIYFRNTCTVIEFTLSQENISKITFSGNNNELVAGEFKASFDSNNKIVHSTTSNSVKSIEITPAETSTFVTGKKYYFVFLPGTFSKGYSLTFTRNDGYEATYTRSTAFTFNVGTFYTMNNKDSGLTFISSIQQNNEIRYTTVDGSLVSFEAYSYLDPNDDERYTEATMVSNQYVNGIGIMTFSDDIVWASVNMGKEKIASISFPSSVNKLGNFNHCENLASVTVLGNLQEPSLNSFNPFAYCPNLESFSGPNANIYNWLLVVNKTAISATSKRLVDITIYNTGEVTKIGPGCFAGVNTLKTAELRGIEIIGEKAFYGCSNLKEVNCLKVSHIKDSAFGGCSNLMSISLPETLTTIGEDAFSGCSSLTKIDFPSSLRFINAGAFSSTRLINITIPASTESLGEACFSNIQSLESVTVCAIEPPVFTKYSDDDSSYGVASPFSGTYPIYVPKNSLSKYLTNTDWSQYSSRLQTME